jgi:hypothetical protein
VKYGIDSENVHPALARASLGSVSSLKMGTRLSVHSSLYLAPIEGDDLT